MPFLWLWQVVPEDSPIAGGKAAGLAAVIRAGAKVPAGFVITNDTEDDLIGTDVGHYVSILERDTGTSEFAVRSSARVEDSSASSYAGIFVTFLRVPARSVPSAAIRCRTSVQTERLLAYNRATPIEPPAVVVQVMIEPEWAGVCFTVDPVTMDHAVIVVEVVPGGGEPCVGGNVTPETIRVARVGGRVIGRESGDTGAAEFPAEKLGTVVGTAIDLEARIGRPLDIEFAVHGSDVYILQARPVTTIRSPF
jgi:pyruvate,water dikinase